MAEEEEVEDDLALGGGVPSTKIRDGGTSQLLSGFGVLVNRSN